VIEIDIAIGDSRTGAFETFKGLTWGESSLPEVRRRHYATALNTRSRLVYVQPPGVGGLGGTEPSDLSGQPMTADGFPVEPVVLGVDGDEPSDNDFVGQDAGPAQRSGIQALQDIDDVRIIAAPGEASVTVQSGLITQAERMRYRFAVLDAENPPLPPTVGQTLAHRNNYDSSFGAFYTPWVQIGVGDDTLFLPPSGHVVGIYARTDNDRGVWKAPANEVVRGITGMRSYITTGEQDILNPRGVNAIRRFEGRGIRVWGARTLSSDPEYRYVNVRRFLIFMEASIDRGTQWVVFEPNSPETWSRVVDSVSAFLHTQWRDGALFGRKPEDAFFVRCDETTMTVDDVQNGRLICEIGVAIVRPAEFVIFRIEQITGFGKAS
jgi:phage tail sheath protein FI